MFPATTNGGGTCTAFPDTCKTPSPGGPVPMPYPNISQCSQGKGSTLSKKVKIVGKKVFTKKSEISRSQGDEAGTLKGVVSNTNMDATKRTQAFNKCKIEGSPITTVLKPTGHNGSNSNAPPGAQLAPSQTKVICMG
jgi:hypothetical protein